MLQLARKFSKLSTTTQSIFGFSKTVQVQSLHTTPALQFQLTQNNYGSVTKKKRKQDPSQLKAKEERRRKRLSKALRKMEKKERLPKPLIECEVPIQLHKERSERLRAVEVSPELEETRILHMKDWTRHLHTRNHNEIWEQDRILISQQKALDELKKESVALYDAAIQFDQDLVPINFKGPVATPPIKDYIQDGEYKETTPTFKVMYEDTEAFLKELLVRRRKRKKSDNE